MSQSVYPRLSSRMLALDLLRGFFIVIIIIDHVWRWPSLLGYITGQGELWVSAGEGFVIISGLLIGYVRGYKSNGLRLVEVSKKIWKRAVLLYAWLVGLSIIYTLIAWHVQLASPTAKIPLTYGDWPLLLRNTLLTGYAHPWIYFLYFYTLLLAVAPIAIYLLRARRAYAVFIATTIGYVVGRLYGIEWMQWIPLFFIPAIAGYYLPNIQARWSHTAPNKRLMVKYVLYCTFGLTLLLSVACRFVLPENAVALTLNNLFSKEFYFPVMRIPIALLWFVAFAMIFHHFRNTINHWFGWLLLPFGFRSLTAYIIHGSILFLMAFYFSQTENIWYNTAIGCVVILLTLAMVRNRYVQKIVPQ